MDSSSADDELVGALKPLRVDPAAMQDQPMDDGTSGGWRVDFNTWIWVMGIEGDIGARGLVTDVSASFSDVLEASDSLVALSGRVEVGYGKWGGFIDGMWASIGVDDVTGPLGFASVDITFEQVLIDFGIMYRIGDWEPSGNAARNRHNVTLDLYAGARFNHIDIELAPAMAPNRQGDIDWIDPIVGAKLVLPVAEHWHLRVNGDVGGFGAASDFTWSATAVIGYDFELFDHPAALYAGYRAIGTDYTEGSGDGRFVWDVVQHGAILGFRLLF